MRSVFGSSIYIYFSPERKGLPTMYSEQGVSILLEPQSRFGDKPVKFQLVCPQNGTAVLKGLVNSRKRSGWPGEREREPSEMMIVPLLCSKHPYIAVVVEKTSAENTIARTLCANSTFLRYALKAGC